MSSESGFIYLWHDKERGMYYLGKHWGSSTDGYICSSKWMKSELKLRPQHFARRILETIHDKELLCEAELKWGRLIRKEELGVRYYNLVPPGKKQWHDCPASSEIIKQKIALSRLGKFHSPESRKKMADIRRATRHSLETREKMSVSHSGKRKPQQTVECPYCLQSGNKPAIVRWHFDHCKKRA